MMDTPVALIVRDLAVTVNAECNRPLSLDLAGHTLLQAPPGPVRSALLLACAGRWAGPSTGTVRLARTEGSPRAQGRALRRDTAIAAIPGLVVTEPRHSVAEARDERALYEGLSVAEGRAEFEAIRRRSGLEFDLAARVGTLGLAERTALDICLGMIRPSTVLIFDGLGDGLDPTGRDWLRHHLPAALGRTVLLAGVSDISVAPAGAATMIIDILRADRSRVDGRAARASTEAGAKSMNETPMMDRQ